MWDNVVGMVGVCASIFAGAVFAQAEGAPLSGMENVSALAILGMTMWYLLTKINDRLGVLNQTIQDMRTDIKLLQAEIDENEDEK